MQEAMPILDPFAPLVEGGYNLTVPKNFNDAYGWVAVLADGGYVSELRADAPVVKWNDLSVASVLFLDLIPIPLRCPEHDGYWDADCVRCSLASGRAALRPHRLQVPEGGVAHFERRKIVEQATQRVAFTWTVLGWKKTILTAPTGLRHKGAVGQFLEVEYYVFFDDFGRTFSSPRLDAV